MRRVKIVLQIKKNKCGVWPFVRNKAGEKMIFSSFKKASDYARSLGAKAWRSKRIDV